MRREEKKGKMVESNRKSNRKGGGKEAVVAGRKDHSAKPTSLLWQPYPQAELWHSGSRHA